MVPAQVNATETYFKKNKFGENEKRAFFVIVGIRNGHDFLAKDFWLG